mmetsp:Transcript_80926/g.217461  ORF Transcript_80926/g.217461 Transcript_80926/m.217461 type:complete len:228 (+) Transcript_80926:279-962(+)
MGSRRRAEACGLQTARTAHAAERRETHCLFGAATLVRHPLPARSRARTPGMACQQAHAGRGVGDPKGPRARPSGRAGRTDNARPLLTGGGPAPGDESDYGERGCAAGVGAGCRTPKRVPGRAGAPLRQCTHPQPPQKFTPTNLGVGSGMDARCELMLADSCGKTGRSLPGRRPSPEKTKNTERVASRISSCTKTIWGAPSVDEPQARRRRAGPRLERWVHRQAKRTC